MGVLEEISKEAPELGILEDMEGRVPVKGHTRKKRGFRAGAAIGGAAGGLAGKAIPVPGASVGTAGVGGAVGEALQQGLETVPVGMTQNPIGSAIQGLLVGGADAKEIARAGAEQAAMEAAGGVVGAGVKKAGVPLMRAALRVTPEAAQTAVKAGVTATKEGAKKILERLGDAGQVALNLTRGATASGIRHDSRAIEKEIFNEMTEGMKGLPGDKMRRQQVHILGTSFLREHGMGPMSPTQLHLAKQRADALASSLHKAAAAGQNLNTRDQLALKWYKNFADKARALLEPIPGYKDVNDVSRALIEVKDALSPAARKGRSFGQAALERGTLPATGAVVGGSRGETGQERAINAAIGAGIGAGVGTPQSLSLMALQTQNPLVATIISNLIRLGRGAYQQGEEY